MGRLAGKLLPCSGPSKIAFSRAMMRPVVRNVSGTKKSVVISPWPMSSLSAAAIGSYTVRLHGWIWSLSLIKRIATHADFQFSAGPAA